MSEPTLQLPSDPSSAAVGDPAAEVGTSRRAVWTDEFLGDAGGDLSAVLAGRIKDQERTGGIPNAVLDGMLASVQRHDRVELARDRLEAAARRWAQPFEGRTVMTVSVSGTAILTALREIDKAREVTSDAL